MRKTIYALFLLLLVSCASLKNDEWVGKLHELVINSTEAHTRVLEIAGAAYRAEAQRCTSASTLQPEGASVSTLDTVALTECMRSANNLRTQIENTATIYRENAIQLLESKSWGDVLLKLPALRDIASKLGDLIGGLNNRASDSSKALLTAPINKAEEN
jgi:hypothetical protein